MKSLALAALNVLQGLGWKLRSLKASKLDEEALTLGASQPPPFIRAKHQAWDLGRASDQRLAPFTNAVPACFILSY